MMKMATGEGSPSDGVPEQGLDWFLVATETCSGGISDLGFPQGFLEYLGIYRPKNRVRGASRDTQGRGRPPPSPLPRDSSDLVLKSYGCLLVQEKSSRRFYSVWTPFGIPFLRNSKTGKKQERPFG